MNLAGLSALQLATAMQAYLVWQAWSTLKIELIYWPATTFAARAEAQAALFRYIDGWQKPRRIQQGLVGRSPDEYEAAWQARQRQPARLPSNARAPKSPDRKDKSPGNRGMRAW